MTAQDLDQWKTIKTILLINHNHNMIHTIHVIDRISMIKWMILEWKKKKIIHKGLKINILLQNKIPLWNL